MFKHFSNPHPIKLSVLFLPFDAAKSHYRRNAKNGVKGYYTNLEGNSPDSGFMELEETVEPQGSAMLPVSISNNLAEIIEAICENIRKEKAQTVLSHYQGYKLTDEQIKKYITHQARTYPNLIFLSERPKGVDFPDRITLTSGISYYKLDTHAGSRRVQQIFAYVREDLVDSATHQWITKAHSKYSTLGKVEHILAVQYTYSQVTVRVAGLHLSAANTGASFAKQKKEVMGLENFCSTHDIHFAIGDFNMNMNLHGGHVGARPDSTVYVAPDIGMHQVAHDMYYQEQYTNSTNTKHYMGHIIFNHQKIGLTGTNAGQSVGLSSRRSIAGKYYSDHAPIYAELNVNP